MTFYEILVHAALIVWTLLGLAWLVGLFIAGPRILGTLSEINEMADIVRNRLLPTLDQSQDILEQLNRISASLVDDFEIVDHTIVRAAESVERMVELTENRVAEMNALLTVAIEEAEDTFVSVGGLLRAVLPGRKRRRLDWLPGRKRSRFG